MKKKLQLKRETVAVLAGRQLLMIQGGVIQEGDTNMCSVGCWGTYICTGPSCDVLCETYGCSTGPICTNSGGDCGPSRNVC